MKNGIQKKLVMEQMRLHSGFVSRNWALRNYISRLSAIILELKKEGWEISSDYVEENGGKNFYYKASKMPEITLF